MAKSPNTSKPGKKSGHPYRASRAPTDIDRRVGINLRELRLSRALTLAELASEMEISHQQLQKYETGINRLSAGMMCAAAAALNVEIGDLFVSSDVRGAKPDPVAKLRDEAIFWIRRIRSQNTLRMAVRILKALAS
jgi:transcriptional regulator with XRE-family HTH domain